MVVLCAAAAPFLFAGPIKARIREAANDALLQRFPYARLGDRLELRWPAEAELGPIQLALIENGRPVVHVEKLRVRVRLSRLLDGKVEPSLVAFSGIRIEGGEDGKDFAALADATQKAASKGSREGSLKVAFDDVVLAFDHGTRIEAGPFSGQGQLIRDASGRRANLEVSIPGGGTVSLAAPASDAAFLATATLDHASLSTLRPLHLPVKIEGGNLSGRIDVASSNARIGIDLQDFSFSAHRIANGPVGPLRVRLEGPLSWELAARKLSADDLVMKLGNVDDAPIHVSGDASLAGDPTASALLSVENVSYAKLVAGLPEALAPGEGASGVDGPLTASVGYSGALDDRDSWDLDVKLDLAPMRKAARARHSKMLDSFEYRPLTSDGRGRPMTIGLTNPNFVAYEKIPKVLIRSVLLSEDAGFFGHSGFDFDSLEENLLAEHQDGEVIRGGSTISQQLAKNLFLTREKTYARKIREAFLTIALEASLPKERLLEIYFNIIEWGPDLYGIGEAARHYFDKNAEDLTVREAAFLATIIPNPVKYHVYCARGSLTPTWEERMAFLLNKLHETEVIDDAQFQEASTEVLQFTHGGASRPSAGLPASPE